MGNVQQQHNVQSEGKLVEPQGAKFSLAMYHKVQSSIWLDMKLGMPYAR